ncbi:MAG: hypothetical protein K0R17_593 [Rariglobus sp.]|nr:hypothetical protein [Rariglobus sp.]
MPKSTLLKALVRSFLFASVVVSCHADIVAWGDSMTYGTGADHPDKGEKTWPKWFTEFSGIKVIKKGVGGESSRQIRDRMLAESALHAEFTVIWAGRNDYSPPSTTTTTWSSASPTTPWNPRAANVSKSWIRSTPI